MVRFGSERTCPLQNASPLISDYFFSPRNKVRSGGIYFAARRFRVMAEFRNLTMVEVMAELKE
jgi:hypothetical protein